MKPTTTHITVFTPGVRNIAETGTWSPLTWPRTFGKTRWLIGGILLSHLGVESIPWISLLLLVPTLATVAVAHRGHPLADSKAYKSQIKESRLTRPSVPINTPGMQPEFLDLGFCGLRKVAHGGRLG